MKLPAILSATLGLSNPWQVTDVAFSDDRKRLDITIEYSQIDPAVCPYCGALDTATKTENTVWFHESFLNYQTYLHTRIPRTTCCQNVFSTPPPWSHTGSRFTIMQ